MLLNVTSGFKVIFAALSQFSLTGIRNLIRPATGFTIFAKRSVTLAKSAFKRAQMWLQLDGPPPHFALRTTTNTYQKRWLERGKRMSWPPRSLDLNLIDFFL